MGWSIGYDNKWSRDIGYGVPAFCDHPGCNKEIDRGLSYVCGQEPHGGDYGCGLFFCAEHLYYHRFRGEKGTFFCKRCCTYKPPYSPKTDHPEWIKWKLSDASWEKWRSKNPYKVKELIKLLKRTNE